MWILQCSPSKMIFCTTEFTVHMIDLHWNWIPNIGRFGDCKTYYSKRDIPLVSLLLWRKMVAMHCFVWSPALQLWSGRQAGWLAVRLKSEF